MDLIDVNCFIGRWPTAGYDIIAADSLAAEQQRLGVTGAWVRHTWGWHHDLALGNEQLLVEVAGLSGWRPAMALGPDLADGDPDQAVERVLAAGAPAVALYPRTQAYALARWCVGPLLDTLEERRVPLLLEYAETTWPEIHALLTDWPRLSVIVTRTGYRILRQLLPILEACPNLHVDTAYLGDNGALELIVRRFGPERVLFGTGTPVVDGAGPLAHLTYADITDEARALIAAGNARRLAAQPKEVMA